MIPESTAILWRCVAGLALPVVETILLTRAQLDMSNIPFCAANLSFNHLRRTVPSDLSDIQTMVTTLASFL